MDKTRLILVVCIVLAFAIGILLGRTVLTGNVIVDGSNQTYSYTKAFCNFEKDCIDFLVHCENGDVAKIEPISRVVRIDSLNLSELSNDDLCNR